MKGRSEELEQEGGTKANSSSTSQTVCWHPFFWTWRHKIHSEDPPKNLRGKVSFQTSEHVLLASLNSMRDFVDRASPKQRLPAMLCPPSSGNSPALGLHGSPSPHSDHQLQDPCRPLSMGTPHSFHQVPPALLCLYPLATHFLFGYVWLFTNTPVGPTNHNLWQNQVFRIFMFVCSSLKMGRVSSSLQN